MRAARPRHWTLILVSRAVWPIAIASVVALVIGRFGARCDVCDVLNIAFPYWQAATVASLLILSMICVQRGEGWRPVVVFTAIAIAAGLREPMPTPSGCDPGANSGRLKVVTFNGWMNNPNPGIAAHWIRQMRPDVVVLVEAKGGAGRLPALLARDFPYQVACLSKIFCSTRVLSRFRPTMQTPLGQGDVENRKGLSAAALSLTLPNRRSVTVFGVHLSRPLPLGQQRRELSVLEDRLAAYDPASLIIAGDFNVPQESMTLRRFAINHELGRVTTGATWPTAVVYPHIPSLLALDHVFLGSAIGVIESGVGPVIGSDHRAAVATVCLKERG